MTAFRLLLVDDDDANLITLSALLEGEDIDVHTASSTQGAESALRNGAYEAVVVDYRLGSECCDPLLDLIRSLQPRAKVVVLSGDPPSHLAERVDALIPKGERFKVLLDAIRDSS